MSLAAGPGAASASAESGASPGAHMDAPAPSSASSAALPQPADHPAPPAPATTAPAPPTSASSTPASSTPASSAAAPLPAAPSAPPYAFQYAPQAAPPAPNAPSGAPSGAPPAAQLAPALFSLARSGGTNVLTLQLEPASLGHVEVEITRPPEGPATVKVTAEQPETLLLLVRDQPALQQALDRAGLTLDPRSVSFHLAPPAPSTTQPAAQPVSAPPGTGGQPGGFGFAAGGAPGGAARDPRQETAGSDTRTRRGRTGAGPDQAGAARALGALPAQAWLRAGLDITA